MEPGEGGPLTKSKQEEMKTKRRKTKRSLEDDQVDDHKDQDDNNKEVKQQGQQSLSAKLLKTDQSEDRMSSQPSRVTASSCAVISSETKQTVVDVEEAALP